MGKSFKLEFPNQLSIELICGNAKLSEFIERQFRLYIFSIDEVDARYFIEIKLFDKIDQNQNRQLSRNLFMKKDSFSIMKETKSQLIDYKFDFNNQASVSITFRKKLLYYLKNIIKSSYSMNHILFYQTVLYPVFSLYAMLGNYHNVHASLLKIDDKYIVFAGLDGVGKSSFTTELALMGYKVLADNFLLFNGENFIALNMPIRLDLDNSINTNIIYQDNNLKEVLFYDKEMQPIKIDKVYFLSISEILDLKPIDSNSAYINWSFVNNGAGEILDANIFCLPFLYQNMLNGFKSNKDDKIEFYSLGVPKGKIKDGVNEILCQLDI